MTDVVLLAMPFAALEHPSIALGLLNAALHDHHIEARVLYPNLQFAERVGLKTYHFITNYSTELQIGEWAFAASAFPDFQGDHKTYLANCEAVKISSTMLQRVKDGVPGFIDDLARQILAEHPRVVGCSSVFQQHCPSLAILRRIRELAPDVITVLGGANCEGSMGLVTHQECEWVDFVVSGEADWVFPRLCQAILAKGRDIPLAELPSAVLSPASRLAGYPLLPTSSRVENLETLPLPDYTDYFSTLQNMDYADQIHPAILMETSRGCWWGAKNPCAFCSLNGKTNQYRCKSAPRIINELQHLTEKYGLKRIEMVDNILNLELFDTVLPYLARTQNKYTILFETKANLKKEQVRLLAEAGVNWVQSGIENLDGHILKKLNKGNQPYLNVQFLKWAMQHGIYVIWNFLVNIPGELDAWYGEILAWLPLIAHLHPPTGQTGIRFDRFSQYYQDPQAYGLALQPFWAYPFIYPFRAEQLAHFAYYFQNHAANLEPRPELVRLNKYIEEWQKLFFASREDIIQKMVSPQRPVFLVRETALGLLFTDTRPCAWASAFTLEHREATIYRLCDPARTPDTLLQLLHEQGEPSITHQEVMDTLQQLCTKKALLHLQGRYFALAIEEPMLAQPSFDDYPGGFVFLQRTPSPEYVDPFQIPIQNLFGLVDSVSDDEKKRVDSILSGGH